MPLRLKSLNKAFFFTLHKQVLVFGVFVSGVEVLSYVGFDSLALLVTLEEVKTWKSHVPSMPRPLGVFRHTIIKWLGLERTLRTILSNPHHGQEDLFWWYPSLCGCQSSPNGKTLNILTAKCSLRSWWWNNSFLSERLALIYWTKPF